MQNAAVVCREVPSAVTEEWVLLFGREEDAVEEEFTGFTRTEM